MTQREGDYSLADLGGQGTNENLLKLGSKISGFVQLFLELIMLSSL